MQNMFDCLCSLMLLKSNQLAFGNLQGPLGKMERANKNGGWGERRVLAAKG